MTPQAFEAAKPVLTAKLADAIYSKLVEMGDGVKGLSWFSSVAGQHPKNAAACHDPASN